VLPPPPRQQLSVTPTTALFLSRDPLPTPQQGEGRKALRFLADSQARLPTGNDGGAQEGAGEGLGLEETAAGQRGAGTLLVAVQIPAR